MSTLSCCSADTRPRIASRLGLVSSKAPLARGVSFRLQAAGFLAWAAAKASMLLPATLQTMLQPIVIMMAQPLRSVRLSILSTSTGSGCIVLACKAEAVSYAELGAARIALASVTIPIGLCTNGAGLPTCREVQAGSVCM